MLLRYTKAQASARAAEEARRLNLGELSRPAATSCSAVTATRRCRGRPAIAEVYPVLELIDEFVAERSAVAERLQAVSVRARST